MHNYKALKSAGKVSVAKVEVVDQAKVDEVKDEDGKITTKAQEKRSHEELQVSCKRYHPNTGEAQSDSVKAYRLLDVKSKIDDCKSEVTKIQAKQADWEELEKDLKAL
tara:strand:+ start:124 stop:447 length:324 start_codon:yes stop_codon:yes gene_type:complete